MAFFADLRTAFDSVDREKLVEAMRKRRVREGLVVRCEELIRETRNRVRVGREVRKVFWTGQEVRQGCPASSSLFTLLTADLEEEMIKGC